MVTQIITNESPVIKDFTGFASPGSVRLDYDASTQKLTITAMTDAYYQGVRVNALVSGWVSSAHANTTGHIYYLYYDGTSFLWSTDTFPGFDVLLITAVHYRTSVKFALRECHGFMQPDAHEEFHRTIGTYVISGGTISGITTNSTTASNRRPDVSECVIADEDLKTTNAALTSKLYSQRYLTGTGTADYTLSAAEIVPVSSANPYYNSFSSPNWGQTLMPANSVMSIWLYEVPTTADTGSQAIRHAWVQGQWITQATSGSAVHIASAVTAELARSSGELNLGGSSVISPEYVVVARIIIKYVSGDWSVDSVYAITGTKVLQSSTPSVGMTSVSATAPITGIGTPADPLVMAQATASIPGYISAADFTTFSNKLSTSGGTVSGQVDFDAGIGYKVSINTNNISFARTGNSYINQTGVGGSLVFRVSNATATDTTALTIASNGAATFGYGVATGAFGCNGATPQTAYASGGTISPGAGSYGASSAANFAALVTLVQNMRAALVANGIMS